jgi:glycerophosphoryl diester phosphodiesterase
MTKRFVTTRFELQGHRGARGLFPENTVAGVLDTLALGVSSIELDIAVTADDVVVICHDPFLNADLTRDESGAWLSSRQPLIHGMSFAALRMFDVGRLRPESDTQARFPDQVGQDGLRIPTLVEMLEVTRASGAILDVELKTDAAHPEWSCAPEHMARLVIEVARSCDALERLVVRSFDWRGLAWLQTHCPTLPLAWLSYRQPDPARVIAASNGRGTWAPYFDDLTPSAVTDAQSKGLRVAPWTVNEPADMARLIAWGVDGFCTDRPDLARQVMDAHGLALPMPWPRG